MTVFVEKRYYSELALGQSPRRILGALQHRVELQARVYVEARLAQPGQPVTQRLVLLHQLVSVHFFTSMGLGFTVEHGGEREAGIGVAGRLCQLLDYITPISQKIADILTAISHASGRMSANRPKGNLSATCSIK